jgi:hypothetical protein
MKHDELNIIVKDVLTKEEIEQIYSKVQDAHNSYLMELFTQNISDFRLPETIANKIVAYAENISGVNNLEISEYQFSRYKNTVKEDGSLGKPILPPHHDDTFKEPRFTFDYQIGGNTTWPIIVEDKVFELQNNEALTFSGTHQIHWRKKKTFADNEYIDMVFIHLRKINSEPKSQDVSDIMNQKQEHFQKQYQESKE